MKTACLPSLRSNLKCNARMCGYSADQCSGLIWHGFLSSSREACRNVPLRDFGLATSAQPESLTISSLTSCIRCPGQKESCEDEPCCQPHPVRFPFQMSSQEHYSLVVLLVRSRHLHSESTPYSPLCKCNHNLGRHRCRRRRCGRGVVTEPEGLQLLKQRSGGRGLHRNRMRGA